MTRRLALPLLACAVATCASITVASAATSRSSWVVSQIYNYNHPYAATDSADLATKMATMSGRASTTSTAAPIRFSTRTRSPFRVSAYTTTQTGHTWLGGDTHLDNFDASRDSSGKAVSQGLRLRRRLSRPVRVGSAPPA